MIKQKENLASGAGLWLKEEESGREILADNSILPSMCQLQFYFAFAGKTVTSF